MFQVDDKIEMRWEINEGQSRLLKPRLRLELAGEGSPLEAELAICSAPRCPCWSVLLDWQPSPAGGLAASELQDRKIWFSLEPDNILADPELDKDPLALRLDDLIRSGLTPDDWVKLREWFTTLKLALIERTDPMEIDITDLPDADDGSMIGFVDVFPFGLAVNFTASGETWAVDEQYCVVPKCSCFETALSFLKLMDSSGQEIARVDDPPVIRYNYGSGKAKVEHAGSVGTSKAAALLPALKSAHPHLNNRLRQHHLIMKRLYERQEKERIQRRMAEAAKALPKVGRNEPCPCGSGRKHKHCCFHI